MPAPPSNSNLDPISARDRLIGTDAGRLFAALVSAQSVYLIGLTLVAQWTSPEQIGTYALFISFCAFFTVTGGCAFENAFFVARIAAIRQAVWGVALMGCALNVLVAIAAYFLIGADAAGINVNHLPLMIIYIFTQCVVVVLLAHHSSRGNFAFLAGNRIQRAALTAVIWILGIGILSFPAGTALILGATISALWAAIRLYRLSLFANKNIILNLHNYRRVVQLYRRYPLKEMPALLSGVLSQYGVILLSGWYHGIEFAGLVGLAIIGFTKPAGLISQSIGKIAQNRYAHAIHQHDQALARSILLRFSICLSLFALFGAVGMWVLVPPLATALLGNGWAALTDIFFLFIPILIVSIAMRPMLLLLSVSGQQTTMFKQELSARPFHWAFTRSVMR